MANNSYSVYMHINLINGKKYIGITKRKPSYRWNNGKGYSNQPKFYNAINKYGWDLFNHQIVKDNLPEQCAKTLEKILISVYDTIENGYNVTIGGEGGSGRIVTEETRRKISESNKGKVGSNLGKHFTEEHKQKISEAHKGRATGGRVPKEIIQLKDGVVIAEYRCGTDAAKALNKKSCAHIYDCLNNERKTAYGYEWRYKE